VKAVKPSEEPGPETETETETDGGVPSENPLETLRAGSDDEFDVEEPNLLFEIVRQFLLAPMKILRHDWRAKVGIGILVFYILMGLVGPLVYPETGVADGPPRMAWFEDMSYPLGTDNQGRGLLSMVIYSTTDMFAMMISGAIFTVGMGSIIGVTAGFKGGTVDTVLSTVTDIAINLPGIPIVLVLSVLFRPENPWVIGVVLTIAAWAGLARALRSQVLTLREEAFVEANRAMGIPQHRLVVKSIMPHLGPYMAVNTVQAMRNVIFASAGLYFIGVLGWATPNWGVILNMAYENQAHQRPKLLYWILVPSFVIVGISIGLILLAQSLDRVFNPRIRAKHMKDEEMESERDEGERGGATQKGETSWI
jgi:peptide/nickel transport system permease protein